MYQQYLFIYNAPAYIARKMNRSGVRAWVYYNVSYYKVLYKLIDVHSVAVYNW